MARQYQIPGYGYINAAEEGREYQVPGAGYQNEAEQAAAPAAAGQPAMKRMISFYEER